MEWIKWSLWKITWSSLIIGSIDHFIIDEWLGGEPQFLPPAWAYWNLRALWVLVAITLIAEGVAYLMNSRQEASE
ncbi:MAG: hypothetical protein QGF09_08050 [Rhodospirillales bacterium]|nr:hypothetical protein [Rhodospirillales bacterium]